MFEVSLELARALAPLVTEKIPSEAEARKVQCYALASIAESLERLVDYERQKLL